MGPVLRPNPKGPENILVSILHLETEKASAPSVIASHSRIDETVEMDREGIASVIIIADQVACFNGKGSSYL
jgi:hypothetical protein